MVAFVALLVEPAPHALSLGFHAASAALRRGYTMSRTVLALTLTFLGASAACAKNLCFQFNSGPIAGSQLVLKKMKLGRGNVGPIQGYLARYEGGPNGINAYSPVYGQSAVNDEGDVVMAISLHLVNVYSGGYSLGSDVTPVNAVCDSG